MIAAVLATLVLAAVPTLALTVRVRGRMRGLEREHALATAIRAHLHDGVCVLDLSCRIVSMNPSAEQLLGVREPEALGMHICEVLGLNSVAADELAAQLHSVQGADSRAAAETVMRPTGSSIFDATYTLIPISTRCKVTDLVFTVHSSPPETSDETVEAPEELYRTLVESCPDSMIVADEYGYIVMANAQAAELHGYESETKLIGTQVFALLSPDSKSRAIRDKRRALEEGAIRNAEYTCVRKNGTPIPVEVSSSLISDPSGKTKALVIVERDVSRYKEAEQKLIASKEHVSLQHAVALILTQSETLGEMVPKLLESVCDSGRWDLGILWMMDGHHRLLRRYNSWHYRSPRVPAFEPVGVRQTYGIGEGLPGKVWEQNRPIWIEDINADSDLSQTLAGFDGALRSVLCFPIVGGGTVQGVIELYSCEPRPVDHASMQAMTTVGASLGQFIKRRQLETALEYQALHDALTGLPNRALLQERLDRALRVSRTERTQLAILLLDLDRFKEVNDTFGHKHGDLLLKQVARRLQSAVRESDTVARLGGDEFAILLPATDQASATVVAYQILQALGQPHMVDGDVLDVGASIGVAVYPEHGDDAAPLLQHADIAMYVAKRGKRGVAVYTEEDDEHSPGKFALGVQLRAAIEQEHLLLHYPPKMDLKTGEVSMVEALVRWPHPEQGLLPPAEFIPLAEETGLIKPLTHWVLLTALRQSAWWSDMGIDLCVAVNVAAPSLHDPELVDTIAELLETTGVEASRLAIEITESAIFADSAGSMETLSALHGMGVRISIDDFGTGYSSLAYLHRLKVDEIKIDKSFVVDMLRNDDGAFITKSVIDLGHNLGLEVVAEGIEDADTRDKLFAIGCDQVQGYYLSRPIPASELASWLASAPPRPERSGHFRALGHVLPLARTGS